MWFSLSQLLKKILKQANKQKENKKSLQFSKLSILRVKFPWKNSHFLEFFHPGSSVIWGISLPATPYSHLVSSRSVDFKASSVQFSHSVVSDALWPHGLQHTRLPCPSPTPRACSNSCPLSWWCHPTIPSPVVPFSSCLQSFPASRSFPVSQFFASGGQSIGVSAIASILPMNIRDWFPLGLTDSISLQSKDSQETSPTPQFQSINSLVLSFVYSSTLTSIHDYWKNHIFD